MADHPLAVSPTAARLGGRAACRAILVAAGPIPPMSAFVEFVKAGGTPMPVAPTERLVVSGFNRCA